MTRRDTLVHWGVSGLAGAVLLVLALLLLGPEVTRSLLHSRRNVLETLVDPVPVRTITSTAVVLDDGREWLLPGPLSAEASMLLNEATRGGMELDGAGRAFGLIPVHHWCGNDPIALHVARVDLEQLLRFVAGEERLWYGPYGWDVRQYHDCFGYREYDE